MSRQTYDELLLTEYLLGSLPEDETARLDELSLTDSQLVDMLKVVEKDLVDAHALGELAGQTLERFNSFYLVSPLRRQKLKFAMAFQDYAEKAAGPQESLNLDVSESVKAVPETRSILRIFGVPRLALQWGLAAAGLVLLLGVGWLLLENSRLRQQMSQTQERRSALGQREGELQKELEDQRTANEASVQELARVREEGMRLEQELKEQQAQQRAREEQRPAGGQRPVTPGVSIVSFTLAPQMRGVGQVPTVSIPTKTDYLAVRLNLEPDDHPAYRVVLLDQARNQHVWQSGKLRARVAGDFRTLSISLPADLLRPQTYILQVSGVSPNGGSEVVSDYPFRVVK